MGGDGREDTEKIIWPNKTIYCITHSETHTAASWDVIHIYGVALLLRCVKSACPHISKLIHRS